LSAIAAICTTKLTVFVDIWYDRCTQHPSMPGAPRVFKPNGVVLGLSTACKEERHETDGGVPITSRSENQY